MKIAIKNPAPRGANLERWGDFHFGTSLADALRARGAEVVQHFWPDWPLYDQEDAAIWLRGKRRCEPRPDVFNALWILSHPGSVAADELDAFDVVYAGSARLAEELATRTSRPVEVLRQCTDARVFDTGSEVPESGRQGLLFVANSRNLRRPILEWALSAGLKPSLVGQGWQQLGLGDLVLADYVPNAELPALYASARYGMNDHWGDMAHYQIINNRIFDSLACGLPLITDGFPELHEVAGDAVRIVDDARTFRDAYWELRLDYAGAVRACREHWKRLGAEYTFDARARRITEGFEAPRSCPPPAAAVRATNAAGWAADLLKRAGGLGTDPAKITRSLLHVCPHHASSGVLAATPSLSAVSGGLCQGPWNIRLDGDLADIRGRKFDVIYIEDAEAWRTGKDPARLLSRLANHVKLGGLVSASENKVLEPLLDDPRFGTVSASPLVLRRTVENLLEPSERGIPSRASPPPP